MEKKSEESENLRVIEERKKNLIKFVKEKNKAVYYFLLGIIVLISVFIRTRNISKLKDITTGTWTLAPDLDPFLFLRWAKDIVANGSLMVHDAMRYVPLGYNTAEEMKLLSYMIAWFYHFLSFFSRDMTITYAAILFPVFMFAATAVAFFLFSREIFYKEKENIKNIIATIATLIFALVPSLLPRTIAGVPEKESVAFCFMFLAFYFFMKGMKSEKIKREIIFSLLAGISTGLMALTWGGVIFIFFAIPIAVLLSFVFGKIEWKEFYVYAIWLISSFAIMMPFSTRYSIMNLVESQSTGSAIAVLFLIGISLFLMETKQIKTFHKFPKQISSLIASVIFLIAIISFTFGFGFLTEQIIHVKNSLINPVTNRFGMTVAENKQPYFISDWKENFGPILFNLPLFFWLFFVGSVVLFNSLLNSLKKKERLILTFSYFIFLVGMIFSKYSPSSMLNGTSGLSVLIYFGGWIIFLGSFGYFYYKEHQSKGLEVFKEFNFSYILYFIILTLAIIASRSGIRLVMALGAVSPVAIAFLIVKTSRKYLKEKEETIKFFVGLLALLIIVATLFTCWVYYKQDKYTAENYAPGVYQWQWQNAMAWVRDNTSADAVFAHWWDYGYWLQSIGERATILDGGNAMGYWNYLMGRYVLTESDTSKTLEFLYSHNGTHLLIDSTEIGKYTAYSSIGSDVDYDRFSWISTFLMDDSQTRETNNETVNVYLGGTNTDEDIIWEEDGKEIFLPKRSAGIGAIVISRNEEKILQPKAIFVYNNKQYTIPLRYLYIGGKLIDFNSGLDAGFFVFPKMDVTSDGKANINYFGAGFYLSRRTVHTNLARLYLFGEDSKNFKLVHSEDNLIVQNIKQQNPAAGDFIYYQGFNGPIKIWEIAYSEGMTVNQEYLGTGYPPEVQIAKEGEYG